MTLDMNLNGQPTTEIAEILRARRIPFVIVTGYEVITEYPGVPIVRKPYTAHDIETGLLNALGYSCYPDN